MSSKSDDLRKLLQSRQKPRKKARKTTPKESSTGDDPSTTSAPKGRAKVQETTISQLSMEKILRKIKEIKPDDPAYHRIYERFVRSRNPKKKIPNEPREQSLLIKLIMWLNDNIRELV